MELQVVNANGQAAATISVADEVFARAFNEPLIHQVLVALLGRWQGWN